MTSMTLIAEELTLGYGTRRVVDGLSIALPRGRVTALLGPNGCGKSTLLRGLAGLLAPRHGGVTLDGIALQNWPRKQLARRVAFLRQTQDVPEDLTVQELVRHGRFAHRRIFGGESREDRDAVNWALDVTGLTPLRGRSLGALSGGERQRAWIALALAQKAGILLLDEPTTYLDLGHQLEVMQTLRQLNEDYGLTLVMSLHDLNQAMRFAHRALVMQSGHLVADGTPTDVLTPTLLASVFSVQAQILDGAADGFPLCHPLRYPAAPTAASTPNVLPLMPRVSNDRS
ncbi:iron complex transport system ATP-binding protein [Burkholderia sp. OK233]|nr:iron complex transport system ATP-binding protein [Burkholderia sp. OK233]